MNSISTLCLLCHEEPSFSSPTASPKQRNIGLSMSKDEELDCISMSNDKELDCILQDYLQREKQYAPQEGYSEQIVKSPLLSSSRSRATRYIILVCSRLDLSTGTAFKAVNYLDRFISKNCNLKWREWMVELLAIACLSIACKLDEVSIPSFDDLQIEDQNQYMFESGSIQQMELTVLKALDWRLSCLTPSSYITEISLYINKNSSCNKIVYGELIGSLTLGPTSIISPLAELLLCALLDARCLDFAPSDIAASALRCSARYHHHPDLSSILARLVPLQHRDKLDECERIMEELVVRRRSW